MTIREFQPMRSRLVFLAPVLALAAIAAAGCGGSGPSRSASASQTVVITMRDIAFTPDRVTVPPDRPVRFVFNNTGKLAHEAFIGDDQAQMDHEMGMSSSMGGMAHGPDAITVQAGQTGTLTHTFGASDRLLIGCHEPGHYAAGMKVAVTGS
jgi:uncharacterized cupredoxin-like copper-binding protein